MYREVRVIYANGNDPHVKVHVRVFRGTPDDPGIELFHLHTLYHTENHTEN